MIPITSFAGQKVALFGLGGSGEATALALTLGGASIYAWDDDIKSRERALQKSIPLSDLSLINWEGITALVLSPGVPLTQPHPHWSVEIANSLGIPIIGDIELFFRERAILAPQSPCVCITGTNGKSTTTALISHILRSLGQNVQMGGNIGIPVLALDPPAMDKIHVLEISSFQSALTPSIAPSVGVLLNLAEDHLDRHGSMALYAQLKQHVLANANTAVVGQDDELTQAIGLQLQNSDRHTVCVSGAHIVAEGFGCDGQDIVHTQDSQVQSRYHLNGINALRGKHNAQNAAAALATVQALGFKNFHQIQNALEQFPGLAHRMEQVGQIGNIVFINDSKATNADATQWALSAFESIYWIVGGKAKSDGIDPLSHLFSRISKAYLIGDSSARFAKTLEGKVPYQHAETLENATQLAFQDACTHTHDIGLKSQQAVILLSPACASYDQFKNFEHRGEIFRTCVHNIIDSHNQEHKAQL